MWEDFAAGCAFGRHWETPVIIPARSEAAGANHKRFTNIALNDMLVKTIFL